MANLVSFIELEDGHYIFHNGFCSSEVPLLDLIEYRLSCLADPPQCRVEGRVTGPLREKCGVLAPVHDLEVGAHAFELVRRDQFSHRRPACPADQSRIVKGCRTSNVRDTNAGPQSHTRPSLALSATGPQALFNSYPSTGAVEGGPNSVSRNSVAFSDT